MIDDAFRRSNLGNFLQPVVSVDNSSIEVVKVGRSETPAVELNHRAEFRGDNGNSIEYHPFGTRFGGDEGFGDFQSLNCANSFGALSVRDLIP